MATTMKQNPSRIGPSLDRRSLDPKQLRHDRWTAACVVAVTLAMIALLTWLASLGGGVAYEGVDYWHMMP